MTPRLLLCLVGLVGLSVVRPTAAQTLFDDGKSKKNPSHVPIPTIDGDPRKLQEMLAKRLQLQKILNDPELLKLAQEVMKDPKKFGVQDQIGKLLENPTKPDLNDPAWRDLLGKVLDPNSSPDTPGKNLIPPEKRDALRKVLEDAAPPRNNDRPPNPRSQDNGPESPPRPDKPLDNAKPPDAENPPDTPPPPSKTPSNQKAMAEKFEWLREFADKARKNNWGMKDSPAWRQFVRDLGNTVAGAEDAKGFGLSEKAGEWTKSFPSLGKLVPADRLPRPNWPRLDPSWLDRLKGVKIGSGGSPGGGWNTPAIESPSTAGGPAWMALVWLMLGVGVVVVAVLFLRWAKDRQAAQARPRWRLGPWPVDPGSVRTREEVVKAFEYLSLLRLGPAVRTWHHRQIASELPETEAASRVAQVYEKARYTPQQEGLTEADLASVRRDLADLAGGSPS